MAAAETEGVNPKQSPHPIAGWGLCFGLTPAVVLLKVKSSGKKPAQWVGTNGIVRPPSILNGGFLY